MSQVLKFRNVQRPRKVQLRVVPRGDEMDDFWPDVLRYASPAEEAAVNPANAPKRVLAEVFALFSTVAVLVLALTLLVPGP